MIVLPTYSDPFYTASYELAGSRYTFDFQYSQREDAWYFHLDTETGVRLAAGVRVVTGSDLFLFLKSSALAPKGSLRCVGPRDPGLYDLEAGADCFLLFTGDDE